MSRKSKRRATRGQSASDKLSPAAAEHKAREHLAAGRFREAVEGFKQLLKQDPRPDLRRYLADAYAGRARELDAKGMCKEALAIWENRACLGEDIALDPDHAALLLRMGRVQSALMLFAQGRADSTAGRARLRSLLAASYLAGEDAVAEQLPADDAVVLHAAPARAALSAYCAGDMPALDGALAAIPFRSPYRDWVQILKALQRVPHEPAAAAGLLARVTDESAFCHLRRAAQLALLPEIAFLEAIRSADIQSVRFAGTLRGWSQARIALWEDLDRLGADPRPEVLLRFMHRHGETLGRNWVRRKGLRLLIAGYPESRAQLAAAGASRLSTEEALLLAAWDAECRENPWSEHERWEQYARHLIDAGTGNGNGSDHCHPLRIALALRRCEHLHNVLEHARPSTDPGKLGQAMAGQLEESLTWDPDDRDTYLRLIGYYRRGKRLTDVRRLLSQASERWPKDMQVLDAAVETALDAGSFKKAAGLAREMLALDSINSGVRDRLVEAHLAHARKQILKGRADLARKELAAAGEWARSAHARDQLDLTAGLLTLIEDANVGAPALRDMVGRLGGGFAGRLALALAGQALRLSVRKLFKTIGLDTSSAAGREDLLATLARLRTHLDGGGAISGELDAYLSKGLADGPWNSLSKSETEGACATLRRCGVHKVRLRVARAALKRWRGEPVFELHAFEAKYPEDFEDCTDKDLERLEAAGARARKEGDTRTALRIEDTIADIAPFGMGPMPFGPLPTDVPPSFALDSSTLVMLIEKLGLDNALTSLGVPPNMKRDLKKLAREQGNEAVVETLASFLDVLLGIAAGEADVPFGPPPAGKSPKPGRGRQKRGAATDNEQDDDPFDQLDLFS